MYKNFQVSNLAQIAQNQQLGDGLTWEEAKTEMNKGSWVRHRFFLPNEAITNHLSMIRFEDDTVVSLEQFEVFRFSNSHSIADWQKGWEVCSKPIA